MSHLGDEEYVQITTFKRDGTAVGNPMWPVPYGDGRVAFTTPRQGGKVKRIRNNPQVTVQPSDFYGAAVEGSVLRTGHAEIVTGAEQERIFALVLEKYGQTAWDNAMKSAHAYFESLGEGYTGDVGLIVTIADEG